MLGTIILLIVIGIGISLIPMTPQIKTICYFVIGVAALLVVLTLVGVSVPGINLG
jgi:hypothetical protein